VWVSFCWFYADRPEEDGVLNACFPGDAAVVTRETLTQSERDWAYAKRALARGDDPEEIIRRIADFRADEKHNPQYYARLTVTNAQTALRSSREDHSVNKMPLDSSEQQDRSNDLAHPDLS